MSRNDADPKTLSGNREDSGRKRLRRWGAALLTLALTPPLAVFAYALFGDRSGPADVGLVFGAKVHPDGTPSECLEARLVRGLSLYRDGVVRRLAVTGGLGVEGIEEADAMRDWLLARGVPPAAIIVDRSGLNTWKSLRFARESQSNGAWGVVLPVSSPTHLLRIRLACRRLGVETAGGASSRYWNLPEAGRVFREAAALAWYAARRDTAPE